MSEPLSFQNLDVEATAHIAENGEAVVVDIREVHEFRATGVIAGAELVPMSSPDFIERLLEIGARAPHGHLALFCHSGGRSAHVAQRLFHAFQARGIALSNVVGGVEVWEFKALPLVPYEAASLTP